MRRTAFSLLFVLLVGSQFSCQEKHSTLATASEPSVAAPRTERSLTSMPSMAVTRYNVRVRHRADEIASPQMLLGNPSNATTDEANRNNYLMIKPYFALAYNNSAGEPAWVSWRICAADLGTAPRKATFSSDDTLPDGFNVITTSEYSGSGFDRGHMCPHSDRAVTLDSSYATFIMTNIVPQSPNNNRKCWAQLENYGRELAKAGNRLYVIAGPIGQGGNGSNGTASTLSGNRIKVPAETFKVIIVTPDTGDDDVANVTAADRVIAVDVPNDQDKCGEAWDGFRCSPASIEAKTGFHFFTALTPDIASALDAKIDAEPIPTPSPITHGED